MSKSTAGMIIKLFLNIISVKLFTGNFQNCRCAHYTENSTDIVSMFLHFYSRYLAGEKKLVEDESEKSSMCIPTAHLKKKKLPSIN